MSAQHTLPHYPVGTVLWKMVGRLNGYCGHPADNKIHWYPESYAIQYADDNKFMFTNGGGSWGTIGKVFFLTRETCLAAWGDKPLITDPPEPESPDPKDLNNLVVWRDGADMSFLTITIDKLLFDPAALEWRHNAEYDVDSLTLEEISDQLLKMIPPEQDGIIEVRIETPLDGFIYQYGNHRDNKWYEYGKLQGYA